MKKLIQLLKTALETMVKLILSRRQVGIRLMFTLFYLIACGAAGFALLILTFLQFGLAIVTVKPASAVKSLSHILTIQIYKMLRYITLNESRKPYPFGPLCPELEPADEVDLSSPVSDNKPVFRENDAASPPASEPTSQDPDPKASSEPIIPPYEDK